MKKVVENNFGTVCAFVKQEGLLSYWLEIPTLCLDNSFTPFNLVRYSRWDGNSVIPCEPQDAEEEDFVSLMAMTPRFIQLYGRFRKMNTILRKRFYEKNGVNVLLDTMKHDKFVTVIYPKLLALILREIGIDEVPQLIKDEYPSTFVWPNEVSKPILTHELYESPSRERNEDKYGTLAGNQCICCMKPMKDGETKWVHMNTAWLAVDVSVSEENCRELTGADSQGCFNIGDSCAKKMPKNFILDDINGKDK